MRRFAILGSIASASPDFRLDDLPGTSGRLDIHARCIRAALLYAHGMRTDVVVYLVLLGGPRAPRTVRIDTTAKFIRPDERALATLLQKTLASTADDAGPGFHPHKDGIALARGGIDIVLADAANARLFLLEESGLEMRHHTTLDGEGDRLFVIGDHLGIDEVTQSALLARGAQRLSVGPVSLHAEDVVTLVTNEMDRRGVPR
jgi:tRNA (pseudouridine54-N1)-methyltransferase